MRSRSRLVERLRAAVLRSGGVHTDDAVLDHDPDTEIVVAPPVRPA